MGYLPQVDDLLGLHPDAKTHGLKSSETGDSAAIGSSGQVNNQDPFAASSQALRMKSDSIALSAAQQQVVPKGGGSFSRGMPTLCDIRHHTHALGHVAASQSCSPINMFVLIMTRFRCRHSVASHCI